MDETAAHLVDRVFPRAPVRQWVLSLPHSVRFHLAKDATLITGVLKLFIDEIFKDYRRRSGIKGARCGGVTSIQGYGGPVNLNVHFHSLLLDGGVPLSEAGGAQSTEHRAAGGGGSEADSRVSGPQGLFRGARLGGRGAAEESQESTLTDAVQAAADREGLERVCRFVLRPPFAEERIERLSDGRIAYGFRRPRPPDHGAREDSILPAVNPALGLPAAGEPDARVRRPRSACAPTPSAEAVPRGPPEGSPPHPGMRPRYYDWATLMKRGMGLDVLSCPRCSGRMKVIATIEEPDAITGILRSMGLREAALPHAPARPLPQRTFESLISLSASPN